MSGIQVITGEPIAGDTEEQFNEELWAKLPWMLRHLRFLEGKIRQMEACPEGEHRDWQQRALRAEVERDAAYERNRALTIELAELRGSQ